MQLLIAGGFVWLCLEMPVALALGSVLRSAVRRDEERWRVLGIAEAFLAATERAAKAASAGEADMDAFVAHRHRAWMVRVDLAAELGERCDAIRRATDVLATLGEVAAGRDGGHEAAFHESRVAFARAVWDAAWVAQPATRQSPMPSTGSTALV